MTDTASKEKLKELVSSGVHVGHRKSKRHPEMIPFIYGIRGNTEIIDVTKTIQALEKAKAFLADVAASGKTILFVGTRPTHAKIIKKVAEDFNMPYVTSRWIGGTFTNFKVISKRLEQFRDLAEKEKSGELAEKYTKAERAGFQRQLARFEEEVGGIREMRNLPDVVVLSSLRVNKLAAKEARMCGISSVAIVDTDTDPSQVDYPIPANDDAISSVQYLMGVLAEAIAEGRERRKEKKEAAAQQPEEKVASAKDTAARA